MRKTGLASLLTLLVLGPAALADETITLSLPPSADAAPPSVAERPPARRANPAGSVKPAPSRRGSARTVGEKVIGRLGVANQALRIYAGRSSLTRALARVRSGTYLALTRDQGDWYGVLMADRSTGWVRKTTVNLLDYQVVAPDVPQRRHLVSMDSSAGWGAGQALPGSVQEAILRTAYTYLGVPYRWGGTAPTGLDCSAFVQRCFATVGIQLPRTAREQLDAGMPVEDLQPADRLYFASRDGRITHTGIYIGNGYFIHSSSSRGGVAVSRLSEPMYRRMYAGARR